VDKYFLKKKRRNDTKPIKNRTHTTYTWVPNGKGRTPYMRSLWRPINSETHYNQMLQIPRSSTNHRARHDT
jgi:hypothetical protein